MPDHTPLTDAELERLQQICDKATKGPWNLRGKGDSQHIQQTNHITRDVWTIPHNEHDMPLIAASRTALPALLRDLRAARERIATLEGEATALATGLNTMANRFGGGLVPAATWEISNRVLLKEEG